MQIETGRFLLRDWGLQLIIDSSFGGSSILLWNRLWRTGEVVDIVFSGWYPCFRRDKLCVVIIELKGDLMGL